MGLYNRGEGVAYKRGNNKIKNCNKREGGLYTGWGLYTGFYGICIAENRNLWCPLQSAIPRK